MINIEFFSIHKRGNQLDEYEDSFLYSNDKRKIAIADGATEGYKTKLWADILVKKFIEMEKPYLDFLTPINFLPLSEKWNNSLNHTENTPNSAKKKAFIRGSCSAFLGLEIHSNDHYDDYLFYKAVSMGDCSLFHFSDNGLHHSFPFETVESFNNRPDLVYTKLRFNRWEKQKRMNGILHKKDTLVLCTDAFAVLMLKVFDSNFNDLGVWKSLRKKIEDNFNEYITQLRESDKLQNDDVTILIIDYK